jgi:(2Fe-2S) ferredoxin
MTGHEQCGAREFEQSEFRVLEKLRYHIFVCTDAKDFCGCERNGSGPLLAALRQELVKRRLMAQVKISIMQCRQPGARGPMLVVHPDGIWYEGLTAEHAAEFVEKQILRGERLARFVMPRAPQPITAVPAHLAADDC